MLGGILIRVSLARCRYIISLQRAKINVNTLSEELILKHIQAL
jgi:hypothetical protein